MEGAQLETTELGSTGMEITRVGFGAWAIGGGGFDWGWGAQDDEDSIAAIHRALELGVNWIDTAAQYGFGHSEEVVGRAIAGLDERPYVFTKGGQPEGPGGATLHEPDARLAPARARGEPRAARARGDRPLPDPLADPRRADRGGLGDARRAARRGPRRATSASPTSASSSCAASRGSRRSRPSSRRTR